MKKVLHIITGLDKGGAENVLTRLCLADQMNHHSVVSLMGEGEYGPILSKAGIEVHSLGMTRGKAGARSLWRLWKILRQERPDVVQTWMYHADLIGGIVARLAGVRHICWNIRHSELEPNNSARLTIIIARICGRISRWIPRKIIVCAHRAAEVHSELGYDRGRMIIIGNGYNLVELQPNVQRRQALRGELGLDGTTPILGFVARLSPEKDHETLLLALNQVRARGFNFKALLVGPGMMVDNLRLESMLAAHSNIKDIICLGPRKDIPAIMNALDIHVMSSSAEGFPNVLAEAMACGTPCVSTDVGDASLIVGDTGWIVKPSDPAALADAIENALIEMQDVRGWKARQTAARARVAAKFSMSAMVEAYHAAWELEQGQSKA